MELDGFIRSSYPCGRFEVKNFYTILHTKYYPLNHLKNKIKSYFYKSYFSHSSTPLFSIYDHFSSVVTLEQNFDR